MAYDSKFKCDELDELFSVILRLSNEEECYRFFEDICTVKELHDMGQRLHVARLLRNKKTYSEIEQETGASTTTISRINKCLEYGSDGYKRVLAKED